MGCTHLVIEEPQSQPRSLVTDTLVAPETGGDRRWREGMLEADRCTDSDIAVV